MITMRTGDLIYIPQDVDMWDMAEASNWCLSQNGCI